MEPVHNYVCRIEVIWLWNFSRSYWYPPPAATHAWPEPGGDHEQHELSLAERCSALMEEAEMGYLNGGFASLNQKCFYKQSCMNHK